jgi:hypothetical protein
VLEAATSGPRCHVQRSGGARPSWTGAATPGVTHVGARPWAVTAVWSGGDEDQRRRGRLRTAPWARARCGLRAPSADAPVGAVLFIEAGPMNLLFNISSFSNYSHWSQLVKYEKVTSRTPKIFKLCMLEDGLKRNKFPFGKKSKFPT